jgi:TRAP-type transport system periplasmic protein
MKTIQTTLLSALAITSITAGTAFAQTKWDLPAAYPATNFHTENLTQFAKDVDAATAGKLKITVHANASLFKAPEIKRAVQGGQAQLGEILLAN